MFCQNDGGEGSGAKLEAHEVPKHEVRYDDVQEEGVKDGEGVDPAWGDKNSDKYA